eukprot:TRINITY_DN7749_c0_g1_i2.p1 TRINITY_DN7749_c0_g1~~TRINITY_DN7749_c0_g1_i2.p1  ORF type:complete len:503 (+),score=81.86 TRINITY_DN7749_c0_g1_i2:225-1733(+)
MLNAKTSAVCPRCSGAIAPGDEIYPEENGQDLSLAWLHRGCVSAGPDGKLPKLQRACERYVRTARCRQEADCPFRHPDWVASAKASVAANLSSISGKRGNRPAEESSLDAGKAYDEDAPPPPPPPGAVVARPKKSGSKRGRNELHNALTANDIELAASLIEAGDQDLLNQQSVAGCTPLMLLAMGHGNEALIWRLLEKSGGLSIARRSETRRTAADYAQDNGRSREVIEALRALEEAEMQRNVDSRCPVCGDILQKRPLLAFFWDRAKKGQEDNPLLQRFFADERHKPLLQPRYHQLNTLRSIRKEISESYAVLDMLERSRSTLGDRWHAVDLCCGRSVTAAILALQHPHISVSTVDRLEPRFVPHFIAPEEHNPDGGCGLVKYSKLDVLGETFLEELGAVVAEAGRPTALLGMHLCGFLSVRAVEAFAKLDVSRNSPEEHNNVPGGTASKHSIDSCRHPVKRCLVQTNHLTQQATCMCCPDSTCSVSSRPKRVNVSSWLIL